MRTWRLRDGRLSVAPPKGVNGRNFPVRVAFRSAKRSSEHVSSYAGQPPTAPRRVPRRVPARAAGTMAGRAATATRSAAGTGSAPGTERGGGDDQSPAVRVPARPGPGPEPTDSRAPIRHHVPHGSCMGSGMGPGVDRAWLPCGPAQGRRAALRAPPRPARPLAEPSWAVRPLAALCQLPGKGQGLGRQLIPSWSRNFVCCCMTGARPPSTLQLTWPYPSRWPTS